MAYHLWGWWYGAILLFTLVFVFVNRCATKPGIEWPSLRVARSKSFGLGRFRASFSRSRDPADTLNALRDTRALKMIEADLNWDNDAGSGLKKGS